MIPRFSLKSPGSAYPLIPELAFFRYADIDDQFTLSSIFDIKVHPDRVMLISLPVKALKDISTQAIIDSLKAFKLHPLDFNRQDAKELGQYKCRYEARLTSGTKVKFAVHPLPFITDKVLTSLAANPKLNIKDREQAQRLIASNMPKFKVAFTANNSIYNDYLELKNLDLDLRIRKLEQAADFYTDKPRAVKKVLLKYIKVPWNRKVEKETLAKSYFTSFKASKDLLNSEPKSTLTLYCKGPREKMKRRIGGNLYCSAKDENMLRIEYKRLANKLKRRKENYLVALQSKLAEGYYFKLAGQCFSIKEQLKYW